jgi:hypothetical protein
VRRRRGNPGMERALGRPACICGNAAGDCVIQKYEHYMHNTNT